MKVNFWQVLGFVLIIIGVVLFLRDRTGTDDTIKPTEPARPAATAPATGPTTAAPTAP